MRVSFTRPGRWDLPPRCPVIALGARWRNRAGSYRLRARLVLLIDLSRPGFEADHVGNTLQEAGQPRGGVELED